jgi:hypothetical protein
MKYEWSEEQLAKLKDESTVVVTWPDETKERVKVVEVTQFRFKVRLYDGENVLVAHGQANPASVAHYRGAMFQEKTVQSA